VFGWEAKGFKKRRNSDLWKRFLNAYRKHQVRFVWIRGHDNIPENENCDRLAVEASRGSGLHDDTGYDPENGSSDDLF